MRSWRPCYQRVVLDKNRPKMQVVVNKIDSIHNDYRTMQLEILAGNHSLVTTAIENGLCFQVDLATVYWNSRLATERQRLLSGFTRSDVVYAFHGPNKIFSGLLDFHEKIRIALSEVALNVDMRRV